MQKRTPNNQDSGTFPQVDLPESTAEGLVLPLQNNEIFARMHQAGHRHSRLFDIGHTALSLSATAVIDEDVRTDALLEGCGIFEVVSSAINPECYSSDAELAVVYEVARRFVAPVHVDNFAERAAYAAERLRQDSPVLYGVINEVAARRLKNNEAALAYAIAGAGMMRGMQIRVDRLLAS